jgi:N-acetylmuramoyl-L-alanine amidase
VLHDAGIGLWVKPAPIIPGGPIFVLGESDPAITEIQTLLRKYGYDIPASGSYDGPTRDVIAAFQRHFRPALVDGVADTSTIATIRSLMAARAAQGD